MRRSPLRRAIKFGARGGPLGHFGQWLGHRYGWQLKYGPRIIIDRPQEFMQAEMLRRGVYEEEVVRVLLTVLRPGDVFFDVGANVGQHSLIAAFHGAMVHAFEPVPRLAQSIRDNTTMNGLGSTITVAEVALSSSAGEATIYVAKRADDGSHSLIAGIVNDEVEPIVVQTDTLDAYAQRTGCAPAVVKIDVEGAEGLVLDGAARTIADCRPVFVMETGSRPADHGSETSETTLSRLLEIDYRVIQIPGDPAEAEEIPRRPVPSQLCNYVGVPRESVHVSTVLGALGLQ